MTLTRIAQNQKTNRKKFHWATAGAAALTLLALTSAHPAAAAPASGVTTFGSVDIGKLQTQSTRKTKYDDQLHALQDKLTNTIQTQAKSIMLNAADQNELGTLLNKPKPTDPDRARVTALETKADQAAQQLTTLQQKKDPTPADNAQLGALTDQSNAGQKALQDIAAGYQAQLKKLSDDDNTAFTLDVKNAITAVAQQRGLSVVFTSDIAVYTTNDITDEVIKRINK